MQLDDSSQQHCLLIVYGTFEKEQGFIAFLRGLFGKRGDREVEKWRKKLAGKLAKDYPRVVAPALHSPTKGQIYTWSREYLKNSMEQILFDEELAKIKVKKIPHLTLRSIYNKIARQMEINT